MQLSINGWPPIASHTACIIIGMILSTGAYTNQKKQTFKPTRVESHLNLKTPSSHISKNSDGEVYIRILNPYLACYNDFKIYDVTTHDKIISIPLKENKEFVKSLFKGRRNRPNHIFNNKHLQLCSSTPQVRYE